MSVRNLDGLLRPHSVAVVGASDRPRSIGATVMRNLLAGGFPGPVMPVHPEYRAVAGVLTYRDVASLPVAPDLAVVCTPRETVPGLVHELGRRGARAAVVLTSGFHRSGDPRGAELARRVLEAARPYMLRVLGPSCLGVLVPAAGLNASFAHAAALPGQVALIHQSGALCTALLDWARSNRIGFSHFVSIGDGLDVDFGDVLDYLGSDADARAVLLYVESLQAARKFMSAARAAARNKPVLAIKAGRVAESARAAGHAPVLAGADAVYDAAFRRAGMLRVYDTDELFDAVATLSRPRPVRGEHVAVMANGSGPAVMATDALVLGGGRLASLAAETGRRLGALRPDGDPPTNPVDLGGDADAARYAAAARALLDDGGVDALLILHSPSALTSSAEAAGAVVRVLRERRDRRPVLTSWLGGEAVREARAVLQDAGIPTYETPDKAVRALLHMVRYTRNQEQLMQTPPSAPEALDVDAPRARAAMARALGEEREVLSVAQAREVLAAFGVHSVETRFAPTEAEAVNAAAAIGFPVALKLHSPEILHKSSVHGVVLDLDTPDAVRRAARAMRARLARHFPRARLDGFTVQRMALRPGTHELAVGVGVDPVFGPYLRFGQGGSAAHLVGDTAVALPPLNRVLAHALVSRTRVYRLLQGYRGRPPVDLEAVYATLLRISQLVVECPEVVALDINPLLADHQGTLAVDTQIRVAFAAGAGCERLAIRPYPRELEERARLPDGQILVLRPIRPEDEPAHHELLARLSPEDRRARFFGVVREIPHSQMARLTQIDYDREMAFIAVPAEGSGAETLGVVRAVIHPDNVGAEFAIVVRSDAQRQGIGQALLAKMIRYCRERGTRRMEGQTLRDNHAVLALLERFGFRRRRAEGGEILDVWLELTPAPRPPAAPDAAHQPEQAPEG